MDKVIKIMFWVIAILFFAGIGIQLVSAEKQIKTIEYPITYIENIKAGAPYLQPINVISPNGINEILSFEIELYGDYQRSTTVEALIEIEKKTFSCTPQQWVTPENANNYLTIFDCTSLVKQIRKDSTVSEKELKTLKEKDTFFIKNAIGFKTDNFASNLYGNIKITYITNPPPKITMQVHGTEYKAGDIGKIFIQLLNDESKPINNSACYASVYYPDDEVYKYQQLMDYSDEGIYDFDFDIPYTNGVYPVAILCTVEGISYEDSILAWDDFETGTTSGGGGWDTNWQLSSCVIDGTNTQSGSYSLFCRDDRDPNRRIDSNTTYVRLDYDFWFMATGFGNNEYVYIEMQDASGLEHQLQIISNANADGAWRHAVGSLTAEANNFDFDGQIRFELDTSGNVDYSDRYYIDNLNITLGSAIVINDTEYQIVRGSGEAHVDSEFEYAVTLDYGTLTNETFDGYMYMYYNVISAVSENKTDREILLNIWNAFPCENIDSLYLFNESSGSWDELNFSTYLRTNENDRCGIKYEQDLDVKKTYTIKLKASNFWRAEMLGRYNADEINQEVIRDGCNYYQSLQGFPAYSVPLTTDPNETDLFYLNCLYYFNTFYHYNETISNDFVLHPQGEMNMTVEQMEEMESIYNGLKHKSDILNKIAEGIINVWSQGNDYSIPILGGVSNETYLKTFANISGNYMNYLSIQEIDNNVWTFENRTLTEFDFATSVNTTEVADAVWNYSGEVNSNLLSQIWSYVNRTLTSFNFSFSVNATEVANAVWLSPTRTLTAFDFLVGLNTTSLSDIWTYATRGLTEQVDVNWSEGSAYVWNNSNRTLTENIDINTSAVSDAVWNYDYRYTHGVDLT